MNIELVTATRDDIETIWKMQVEAFRGLLEKYRDYDISPATESIEKVAARFCQPETTYYFLVADGRKVGVVRVVDGRDGTRKRISPLWIMPGERGKGYAHFDQIV